jgi:hypothetical protein
MRSPRSIGILSLLSHLSVPAGAHRDGRPKSCEPIIDREYFADLIEQFLIVHLAG